MKINAGNTDRFIRAVAGIVLALIVLLFPMGTIARGVISVVAGIALLTALGGFCPLYTLLGWNTCRKNAPR